MLNHKHILITATGLANPPRTPEQLSSWLIELVSKVDMVVLLGPYSIRCDTLGNEGVTGIVCIETSHASVHCWDMHADTLPFLKMDLYSCKDFSPADVIEHLAVWQPTQSEYMVIDRNGVMHVSSTGIVPVGGIGHALREMIGNSLGGLVNKVRAFF